MQFQTTTGGTLAVIGWGVYHIATVWMISSTGSFSIRD